MADKISVTPNSAAIKGIKEKYDKQLFKLVIKLTQDYNEKIVKEAKQIIKQENTVDTGKLLKSIKSSVKIYADKVKGEIYSDTEYAKYVHDGAKHQGGAIVSHFVPFSKAPSLLSWAKRHGIIKNQSGKWYFISKSNKQYLISNISKSGMPVRSKPLKFIEKPVERYKQQYINDLAKLVDKQ